MGSQIFISHSRADRDFVDKLVRDLIENGIDVWIDRSNTRGGDRWRQHITEGISTSELVIVVLSHKSLYSENIERELSIAANHRKPLIPIRYQAVETLGSPIEFYISGLQYIPFDEGSYERRLHHLLADIVKIGMFFQQNRIGKVISYEETESKDKHIVSTRHTKSQLYIVYSHADKDFVNILIRDLIENGIDVWVDRSNNRGGDRWRQRITDGISTSELVVVVLSPDSVKSEYIERELSIAANHRKPLIPVHCQPVDTLGTPVEFFLSGLHYIPFYKGSYNQNLNHLLAFITKIGLSFSQNRVGKEIGSRKPQIFIIHSHADKDFVDKLTRDLIENGIIIRIDRSNIRSGDRWRERILEEISKSDFVIVVLSPDSVKSDFIERELSSAANQRKPLIPVRCQSVELLGKPVEFYLTGLQYIPFDKVSYDQCLNQLLTTISKLGSKLGLSFSKNSIGKEITLEETLRKNHHQDSLLSKISGLIQRVSIRKLRASHN